MLYPLCIVLKIFTSLHVTHLNGRGHHFKITWKMEHIGAAQARIQSGLCQGLCPPLSSVSLHPFRRLEKSKLPQVCVCVGGRKKERGAVNVETV